MSTKERNEAEEAIARTMRRMSVLRPDTYGFVAGRMRAYLEDMSRTGRLSHPANVSDEDFDLLLEATAAGFAYGYAFGCEDVMALSPEVPPDERLWHVLNMIALEEEVDELPADVVKATAKYALHLTSFETPGAPSQGYFSMYGFARGMMQGKRDRLDGSLDRMLREDPLYVAIQRRKSGLMDTVVDLAVTDDRRYEPDGLVRFIDEHPHDMPVSVEELRGQMATDLRTVVGMFLSNKTKYGDEADAEQLEEMRNLCDIWLSTVTIWLVGMPEESYDENEEMREIHGRIAVALLGKAVRYGRPLPAQCLEFALEYATIREPEGDDGQENVTVPYHMVAMSAYAMSFAMRHMNKMPPGTLREYLATCLQALL